MFIIWQQFSKFKDLRLEFRRGEAWWLHTLARSYRSAIVKEECEKYKESMWKYVDIWNSRYGEWKTHCFLLARVLPVWGWRTSPWPSCACWRSARPRASCTCPGRGDLHLAQVIQMYSLFEIKMIRLKRILTNAVVLLKVDNVLSNHDRVLDVCLHPFKALDTLVAGVPVSISISLADNTGCAEIFGDRGCSSWLFWWEGLTHSLTASQAPPVWQTWMAPSTK